MHFFAHRIFIFFNHPQHSTHNANWIAIMVMVKTLKLAIKVLLIFSTHKTLQLENNQNIMNKALIFQYRSFMFLITEYRGARQQANW